MSCHLSHRLTPVHRAVSMALLCSVGWGAMIPTIHAATIGETVVTSAQHEPLSASMVVTNINAETFSAGLANSVVYQQMGLTPTDSMSVRFQPTSATSGRVFISTSQPVSKPFADLVLSINDNGQRNVVPKTLLMPLNASVPIKNVPKNAISGVGKPNLPSVSASTAKPLTVRKGAPPPLISASSNLSNAQTTAKSSTTAPAVAKLTAPNIQVPTVTAISEPSTLSYSPSLLTNGRVSRSSDNKNANIDDGQGTASISGNPSLATDDSTAVTTTTVNDNTKGAAASVLTNNKQPDVLNIQVTRQIQPSTKKDADSIADTATLTLPTPNTEVLSAQTGITDTGTAGYSLNQGLATDTQPSVPLSISDKKAADNTRITHTTPAQYQVQRNDSLWIIAQQIAQENDLDTQTVMKQIQSQNPNAFINKDADQLKADAKLSLPSYDVIPSQKNLEAAIDAQKQYMRRARTAALKKSVQTTARKTSESVATKRTEKPKITRTQTLPSAQFSVLAPGRNGEADGTQKTPVTSKGSGLSTDILATLKASRQKAAVQAERLSKTSSSLNSYTKKLQLQNQKLAELQARLKKLRNQ